MYPIIQPKYDIHFKIKNCDLNMLYQLDPIVQTFTQIEIK